MDMVIEILKPEPEGRTLGVSLGELCVVLEMLGCWRLAHELYYHQGLGLSFYSIGRDFKDFKSLMTAWEKVKGRISDEVELLEMLRSRAHSRKTFIDEFIDVVKLFLTHGYEIAARE
jgi:hypothetical protein